MALATYQNLTLSWQPNQRADRAFMLIVGVSLLLLLGLGVYLSLQPVPETNRRDKVEIPERVAKFITEKEKPKPPPPKPKVAPKPPEPKPKVEDKPEPPKVERRKPKEVPKAITEEQKAAREKASKSGILAHMSELDDLMDTPEVAQQLKASVKKSDSAKVAAGHSADLIIKGASEGSGGVDASQYAAKAGDSQLSAAEVASARAALQASEEAFSGASTDADAVTSLRPEEEIILVMDRHKSQLQSLYNRARRSNASLKGKLVLAITILPDGSVSAVKVVSSELNDPALESRLIARIRTFQFGAKDVGAVTVNYPIEFLPY